MVLRLYSLFDRKGKRYSPPQLAYNDAVMVRELKVNLPEGSMPFRYPEDFDLVCLGAMDEQTGVIASVSPELVCSVSAIVEKPAPELGSGEVPVPLASVSRREA